MKLHMTDSHDSDWDNGLVLCSRVPSGNIPPCSSGEVIKSVISLEIRKYQPWAIGLFAILIFR